MLEDWIGEAGVVTVAQPEADDWTEVRFARPIPDPVVVASASDQAGPDPFTLDIRGVTETGFEIRIDEWDHLDGRHGAETVSWIAVTEGRHRLPDGRTIEAGATTLATPGGLRFAEIGLAPGFAAAPVVLAQPNSETDTATVARLDAVSPAGFRVSLQQQEAEPGAVAATLGWIAVEPGAGAGIAAGRLDGVTHAPAALVPEAPGEVLVAALQTTAGPDPASLRIERSAAGARVAVAEERSADAEVRHAAETVGYLALGPGLLGAAPAPAGHPADAPPPEPWSDPATWGGRLPGPDDVVLVDAGRRIRLDTDATVRGVMIHGELTVADGVDLALTAEWVIAMTGGAFRIGEPARPHASDFTLTLTGEPDRPIDWEAVHRTLAAEARGPVAGGTGHRAERADLPDDQGAVLMAMGAGSRIEIHAAAAAKEDWVRLAATAEPGATRLRLDRPTGWEVGDRVAVASTDFEADQAETAWITGVSADGRTVMLDRPLAHRHFGELQSFAGGRVLDTRAEVALLSRNVTIRGDADAALDGFGGHLMVMAGAELRLSGVELAEMGQAGRIGRYPVHWHMVGDASGHYVTDSAIHHSFNRAVTVHGTQNARIEDTVAFDVVGHAYFLEDGSETGNRFERNLGFLTRAAPAGTAVVPTDASHVSTFWIANPDNVFLGNVAGGSEHSGFWFAAGPSVAGLSAELPIYREIDPSRAPLGRFEGNVAHSNAFANLAFDGHADPETGAFVDSEYRPAGVPVVRDFTSYKSSDRAIWVRATAMDFYDVASADNARATFFSYNQTLYDSLIVGRSANTGMPETAEERAQGRSLPEPYFGRYFRGHSIYDGPSGVVDTHFARFGPRDAAFQSNGAAQKSPAHFASGLSFEAVTPRGRVDFAPQAWDAHLWASGLLDLDGSLTGRTGATLLPIVRQPDGAESAVNAPEGAVRREAWGAWLAPEGAVALLRADTSVAPGAADVLTLARSDGERVAIGGTFDTYHQASLPIDPGLTYRLEYDRLPAAVTLSLRFARPGDALTVEVPNLPGGAAIAGAVEVADRAALAAAERTAFAREGTRLVVRLVAEAEETDPRFRPNTALAAAAERRFVAGVRIETGLPGGAAPVVADFEAPDPRLSLAAEGLRASPPERAWLDQPDSIVFWDVVSDGAGAGRADLTIDLGGQDWSAAAALALEAAVQPLAGGRTAGLEVLIRDREDGPTALGRIDGPGRLDLSDIPTARRDAVDQLIFRSVEEEIAPDLSIGQGQRALLFGIRLEPAIEARPVHLAPVPRSGDTFGIVAEAIVAGVRADRPLRIVEVSGEVGGRARTGLPGQGDNVFFETDPGFSGLARFTATLRDAAGREAIVPVSFEVAPR